MSDLGGLRARFRAEYGNPLDAANQYVGALEAQVERLTRRIPDPDDLRLVLDAAEYVVKEHDTGPEPDMLAAAVARLRATLEEA